MPRRALSVEERNKRANALKEERILAAVEVWKLEQDKPKSDRRKLKSVADEFHVKKSTLWDRYKGVPSIQEFNRTKQALSEEQEKVLIDFIITSAQRGFPMTVESIRVSANFLRKDGIDCGHNWVHRLISRHWKVLKKYVSKSTDKARQSGATREAITDHEDMLYRELVLKDAREDCMYGMDETGVTIADLLKSVVVGGTDRPPPSRVGGTDKENISVLAGICADGTFLPPVAVMKGTNVTRNRLQNTESNVGILTSENGWATQQVFMAYLRDWFEPYTREKSQNERYTRYLLVDGHVSHYDVDAAQFAKEHNIVILAYPPHCTHLLQGLDVVCFAKLKRLWRKEKEEYERRDGILGRPITRNEFCEVFWRAYTKAMDEQTVKAAFRVTGVFPFKRGVVPPDALALADGTSTRSLVPLTVRTPHRRIMSALADEIRDLSRRSPSSRTHPTTSMAPNDGEEGFGEGTVLGRTEFISRCGGEDLSSFGERMGSRPTTPLQDAEDAEGPSSCLPASEAPTTPVRIARRLHRTLSQSASASCLVSGDKGPLPEALVETPVFRAIPVPDFIDPRLRSESDATLMSKQQLEGEVLRLRQAMQAAEAAIAERDKALEYAEAHAMLAYISTQHLNRTVHENTSRKKKSTSNGTERLNARSTVITEDTFLEQLRSDKEARKRKAEEVEARKVARSTKRHKLDEWKQAWLRHFREEMDRYDASKAEYDGKVVAWKAQRVPKRLWEAAPVKPRKGAIQNALRAQFGLERVELATQGSNIEEDDEEEDDDEGLGQELP